MVFSLFRKRRPGGPVLVAFASQTGHAQAIAWASANALPGLVRVVPLGGLTAADLAEAGTLLVVTSTYGAGEAPDSARAFARKQMAATPGFKGLDFAVLALGDRKYDATFCGFGKSLDRWLARGGGRRLFDIVCVDGDDDEPAMARWAGQLTRMGGKTDAAALMPGPPQPWLLAERRLLNAGSPGGEAWHIALTPRDGAPQWTAGDIAEVWPRNPQAAVDDFLQRHAIDGNLSFRWHGHWTFLRDIIAHSKLPQDHEIAGISIQWLVERLNGFAPREYSIASLPGRMELLVRKVVRDDGSLGIGSGWLIEHAEIGGVVPLRLRPNPNFHPPGAVLGGEGPMILIGAGTGMAGLRVHLQHRAAKGVKDAWLLFGERRAAHDLFYGEDIAAWQADGTLAKTDLAFSRDGGTRRHVQHLVAERSGTITDWVARGAAIMVCGGLDMAAGVDSALTEILGEDRVETMTLAGLYRRDIY